MANLPLASDRPLPEGVRDLLFTDAATLRGMAAALRTEWSRWGYRELVLPTFEYAGTLSTNVGAQIDAEMYRFFDRHGRTLALRPDMTIPTARVIGTRLFDQACRCASATWAASSATNRRVPASSTSSCRPGSS